MKIRKLLGILSLVPFMDVKFFFRNALVGVTYLTSDTSEFQPGDAV
jgi:hypothetical protein